MSLVLRYNVAGCLPRLVWSTELVNFFSSAGLQAGGVDCILQVGTENYNASPIGIALRENSAQEPLLDIRAPEKCMLFFNAPKMGIHVFPHAARPGAYQVIAQ